PRWSTAFDGSLGPWIETSSGYNRGVQMSLRGFGRRRTVVSVAGSVAAHLLVVAALVWVKPPSTIMTVKRGEPLFVELPEADEPAQRGLPGGRAPGPGEAPPDAGSARRRGGPGPNGAGGSGEGRAGIEGEPLPLDSKDARYNDYLDRVRRMIKEKWAYPCVNNLATGQCEYKSAQLVIEFGILRDGRVPFVIVLKQSDFEIYDEYAVNAIELASYFPPMQNSVSDGRAGRAVLHTS